VSAAAAARNAQPLWSLVPVSARAQYIRRAAVAMLDELDDLSRLLAEETGRPREQIVVSELLPAARGLRELADDGPRALADRRRRGTRIVQAPIGVIGLRGPSASPWAEPMLETAAALLAGNGVLLDIPAERLRLVFLRAGVPGDLVALSRDLDDAHVIDLPRPDHRGIMLVLDGAAEAKVVEAARHADPRMGRIVTVAGAAPGLVEALAAAGVELAVTELPDTESAIALVAREARDAPVSIWAQDDAKGERIARRLPSPTTWIGRHGVASTPADVRLARHVVARRLHSRGPSRLSVTAQTAIAELRYGRESRRWPALRALVRTARRER
jgi:hypothetical protein